MHLQGSPPIVDCRFFAVSQLPDDAFMSWGWRVPFLLSIVLFIVAIVASNWMKTLNMLNQSKKERKIKRAKIPIKRIIIYS
ncbi:hypothetical protein AB6F62_09995 [Providencia huaxiensis]|uniref:hypothetical protein n=1 Tax=Providencia huaxiensis TaxID=2027290 RepID=UPI0034DD1974